MSSWAYFTSCVKSIGETLYNGITSVPESIRSNPKMTLSPLFLTLVGEASGRILSNVTGGRIELNRIIPESVRDRMEKIGRKAGIAVFNISARASRFLPLSRKTISLVLVTPPVEEGLYRFPVAIGSLLIDQLPSTIVNSVLLGGAVHLSGGKALKIALAAISSVGFTYGHGKDPSPGRAMSLFLNGMGLSYLALQGPGGLGNAVVAHTIVNLIPALAGTRPEGREGVNPERAMEEVD